MTTADFTALLTGSNWSGIEVYGKSTILTFSFPTVATRPAYVDALNDPGIPAAALTTWAPFSAAEQALARQALAEWGNASGLILLEVAPGMGDINFQKLDFSGTAYDGAGGIAFRPFGNFNFASAPFFTSGLDAAGDVFMNSDIPIVYGTLLHEVGHALGLKHPTEAWTQFAAFPPVEHAVLPADIPNLSIMAQTGTLSALTAIDQAAIAHIYGPQGADGSQVAAWSFNASLQRVMQTGTHGDDAIRGTSIVDVINGEAGNDSLFGLNGADSLHGWSGNDLIDGGPGTDRLEGGLGDDTFFVDGADKVIELAGAGHDLVFTSVTHKLANHVEDVIALGTAKVNLTGNGLANALFGGETAATLSGGLGDDFIVGSIGRDRIVGGGDSDFVFGGAGGDTFAFLTVADFGPFDAIGDFQRAEGDRIDLKKIDPDAGTAGDQRFTFVGSAAFSGGPAFELRTQTIGTDTRVEIDLDHDRVPDLTITLFGVTSLSASDFVL